MAEKNKAQMDNHMRNSKGDEVDIPEAQNWKYRSCESLESTMSQWDSTENLCDALATVAPRARRSLEQEEPKVKCDVQCVEDPVAAGRRALVDAVELEYDSNDTSNGEMEKAEWNRMLADVVQDMDFDDLATAMSSPTLGADPTSSSG